MSEKKYLMSATALAMDIRQVKMMVNSGMSTEEVDMVMQRIENCAVNLEMLYAKYPVRGIVKENPLKPLPSFITDNFEATFEDLNPHFMEVTVEDIEEKEDFIEVKKTHTMKKKKKK